MATLFDAANALDNRAEEVRAMMAGERGLGRGDLALAMSRLEDGVTTATAVLAREARLGRSDGEEFQRLASAERAAEETLQAGGAQLAATRPPDTSKWKMPSTTQLFTGGIIGFGIAFGALYLMGRRGRGK